MIFSNSMQVTKFSIFTMQTEKNTSECPVDTIQPHDAMHNREMEELLTKEKKHLWLSPRHNLRKQNKNPPMTRLLYKTAVAHLLTVRNIYYFYKCEVAEL